MKSAWLVRGAAFVYAAAVASGLLTAAEFSAEATALPFPPDAKAIEFRPQFGDIEYTSASPLTSLAAFYLKEMAARGWQHDEAAASVEDEKIKLTFKHEASVVQVELRQSSKEVRVSLDCEKLSFTGVDDPAKLAAAGVPVARTIAALHKSFPLPAGAVGLRYTADGCTFKSPLKLEEAFDHFTKLAPGKGFRESRRPIVTATRRYTEFKSGTAEFSVNVFTDAVGSRIILEYKDAALETPVPPLAAVAALPIKGGSGRPAAGDAALAPSTATPIDVTANKGSAIVDYDGKKYTLSYVACYQPKSRGSAPTLIFASKPIPLNKLQTLVATKEDVSFGDIYEAGWPDHLTLQLGQNSSFSFGAGGVSLGRPVENATGEIKVAGGRAAGSLKVPPVKVFTTETFSFSATADVAIITPSTRIVGPGDPVLKSDSPVLTGAPIPFPDGVENAGSEGSKFRKTYKALVNLPVADVTAFYRQELAAKGWKPPPTESPGEPLRLITDKMEIAVTLRPQRGKTAIEALVRDTALAKQEGVFPEAGKGRLVLANGSESAVTFTIGATNYPLRAGQGAKDYKQALNYSLAPGKFTVTLKASGQAPQSETIELTEGTAWGVIALPGGGCLPVQLY